jgi:hypothetical protein
VDAFGDAVTTPTIDLSPFRIVDLSMVLMIVYTPLPIVGLDSCPVCFVAIEGLSLE